MSADTAWPSPLEALVIGASAGGVSALQTVLGSLPGSLQPPVFVVLHVPKDRPSGIPELLGGYCALPVLEADDKQPVRPGHVYFAPPDYHLLVENRDAMALSMDEPVLFSRPSIDVLFESAAAVYGRGLLAILLTGASSDGSEGVAAVRAAGGKAWIQCPVEAASPIMPNAALAHAGADAVLRLGEMCERLKGSNT
ncbi:chemotaxis protein CheB [Luteibacter sp. Lutesp34]|uniref:chemotaxis protein CheB n=1 Tax=Luteibacter sp. Lutesp34 TaxID=3243030 RepID=UPI0039B5ED48